MTDFYIAAASIVSVEEADEHHPLKTIVLLSCAGLIPSLCLMTFGIDLSAGWI